MISSYLENLEAAESIENAKLESRDDGRSSGFTVRGSYSLRVLIPQPATGGSTQPLTLDLLNLSSRLEVYL